MIFKRLSVFSALLFLLPHLEAQEKEIRFRRISMEQGLSHPDVKVIYQDASGFLWFGTKDGLNKFNGYSFRSFKHNPSNATSISDNQITGICEDKNGFLWVSTFDGGVNQFDRDTERFTVFRHDPTKVNSISSNEASCLISDQKGMLWIGTWGAGLNRLDPNTGEFTHWRFEKGETNTLSGNTISHLFQDKEGNLWIGTFKNGVNRFNPETGQFTTWRTDSNDPNGLLSDETTYIFGDSRGKIWVGTSSGLHYLAPETDRLVSVNIHPNYPEALSTTYTKPIFEDREGNLWVGAGGMYKFHPEKENFALYRNNPKDPYSLSSNNFLSIFQDKSATIWLGTLDNGLNKVDRETGQFAVFRNEPDNKNSISDNRIRHLLKDSQGYLWIGTQGGLNRFDSETGQFEIYTHDIEDPNSISNNVVYDICESQEGLLWIATANGVNSFDPAAKKFTFLPFNPNNNGKTGDIKSSAVEIDASGDLWVGYLGQGVSKRDRRTGEHRHFPADNAPGSISHSFVGVIFRDRSDNIWIGTQGGGLNLYRPESENFVTFKYSPDTPKTLSHNVVTDLIQDHLGNVWVGTQGGGLNKMLRKENETTAEFLVYNSNNGLPSDMVKAIKEDSKGMLWISSPQGVSRFNPKTETFKLFEKLNGILGTVYLPGSYHQKRDGELFFGTTEGLTVFHPDDLNNDSYIPPVVLTNFLLFNEPVPLSWKQPDSPLAKAIDRTKKIKLNYRQSVFSFEFAGLHFAEPAKNRYAYKLEGFDDDWIQTDASKRFATYTNLSAETYTFKVKAANKDGVWNHEGVSIQVEVDPPPWKTWWAYCLYALAIVGVILSYLESHRRKLAVQKAVNLRLLEVDKLKDEFLANTSHELRTPLNGIIGLAESLKEGVAGPLTEQARDNLNMIVSSGKRLASLVNDILDFSKMKNHSLELRTQPVDLRSLTDVVFTLSKPLISGKNIKLVNDIPHDAPHVLADEDRLQQILYNLTGNAIKFTHSGQVTASINILDGFAEVCLEDTGIGIAKEKFESIFQSFEQVDGSTARIYGGTGLGLAVTKQLVELHGGTIRLESEVDIGSRFFFTTPLADDRSKDPTVTLSKIAATITMPNNIEPVLPSSDYADSKTEREFNILVVDDEAINRQVVLNHLSLSKYNTFEASNGMEALDILNSDIRIDLTLLDIMMPRMSGYEVCRLVRENHPVQDLPILFLSAKNQVEDLVNGFNNGANDYLTKPVTKNELLSRVHTHLQLMDINRNLEKKVAERTNSLKMKNTELETLNGIVKIINREIELNRVLNAMLEQGLTLFPQAEKGTFMLWDEKTKRFRFTAAVGHNLEALQRLDFSYDEMIQHYTEGTERLGQSVYLVRRFANTAASSKFEGLATPKSLLVMVVSLEDKIEGFLVLDNYTDEDAFSDSDLRKFDRFREHAVSALAKARIMQELRAKNEKILRTQDQLIMQEKMASLGTLTAGVAHELRNPLNFINNFATLSMDMTSELFEEYRNPEGDREEVEELLKELMQNANYIHEHGERANMIIQTMMAMTQSQTSQRHLVDFNQIVEKYTKLAYHGIKPKYPELRISLNYNLDDKINKMNIFTQDFSRALINLIHNAVESLADRAASESNDFQPRLEIETINALDHVKIVIKDNGVGVPEQHLDEIFTPFFTTKPTGQGNIGLGLSICFDVIVQEHGGQIKIDTKEQSHAIFTLSLPK